MGQESSIPAFHRRNNEDGTVDSICLICFRTIGPVASQSDLAEFEGKHICESPSNLMEMVSPNIGST